jgi:hypothetical protein
MAYLATSARLGAVDLSQVITAGGVGTPGNGQLPSVTTEQQLGEVVTAYDTTATTATTGAGGAGEFIFLAVPVSTAITAGLFYGYDPSTYKVAVVATSTTGQQGMPIALGINAVSSNANSVQYTWFQVAGRCTALKTAVQVLPNVPIFTSATAGRIKVLTSSLRCILGARTANATTVTSTTSTVAIYLNGRPVITA